MESENIDRLQRHIINMMGSVCLDFSDIQHYSYYSKEDICNFILFQLIRNDYINKLPEISLLQYIKEQNDGIDNDYYAQYQTDKRKTSRMIRYAQYYRSLQNDRIKKTIDERIPELEPQILTGKKENFEGYRFTRLQYREIEQIEKYPIFKKIVEGQIKEKLRNPDFVDYHEEYYRLMLDLKEKANTPEMIIENSILMYHLEWKYRIYFYYYVAKEAYKENKEIPIERCKNLTADKYTIGLSYPWNLFPVLENKLVLRHKNYCADLLSDDDYVWNKKVRVYSEILLIQALLLNVDGKKRTKLYTLISEIDNAEKAEFIKENFWLWDIVEPFNWEPKMIRDYRKIRQQCNLDQPKPHIN